MSAVVGGADALVETYDVICANINLNVLLADMKRYADALSSGGTIFFSGFYQENIPALREAAEAVGLRYEGVKEREQWRSIKMTK